MWLTKHLLVVIPLRASGSSPVRYFFLVALPDLNHCGFVGLELTLTTSRATCLFSIIVTIVQLALTRLQSISAYIKSHTATTSMG